MDRLSGDQKGDSVVTIPSVPARGRATGPDSSLIHKSDVCDASSALKATYRPSGDAIGPGERSKPFGGGRIESHDAGSARSGPCQADRIIQPAPIAAAMTTGTAVHRKRREAD